MAARKSKGRQAVRNRKGGFPGWGWAVIGIAVGVVAMIVLTRHSMLPMAPSGPQPNPQATVQGGGDKGLAPAESAPKKPQYDFYSVLSEKEVRIPDEQISAQARAEQQQKQQAAQQAQATAARQPPAANPNAPAAVTENIQAAPATAVPSPAAGSGYLLQVGAFPNAADAEALKAKLALQGFVANVQTVQVGSQTFHRVRLGPYRSATELESVQNRLAGAGYKAIALKEGR
ncbi:SPOR domain-containing protein [Frateuria terrea]|uniref:Sporulation related domain-containing protein n=1 Tax=Frateuria terrea TaxID=529704 RepID=A0A1H6T6Q9_9GAMM|nr:SPOR domain-containing protein [Frateuria terrea]SEI73834.1 Sporulation related domain-containing protein [Frateuria terrea]SFP30010.1 Sporulation related domain-containing protein [Frateuria terrea]